MSIVKFFLGYGGCTPTKGSEEAAGFDLSANLINLNEDYDEEYPGSLVTIQPWHRVMIPTGVHVAIPKGYYGRVAPRSGLALKAGVDVLAGVVDSDYRGEIKVILMNLSHKLVSFSHGDRIAQLIVEKIHEGESVVVGSLEELEASERGAGGFGSTGL